MNPFTFDTSDFQFLLDSIGETVKINDVEQKAIIPNAKIGDYEDRYIHTLQPIQRGNLIEYNREHYLVISETVTQRYGKYKALMRHCNYEIVIEGQKVCKIVSYNVFGEPIEECHTTESFSVPAIIDKYTFKIDGFAPIRVPENQIIVTIREDDNTKQKFVANATFEVMDKTWKVVNIDKTRTGLLILTCESSN
ncbi:Ig domain-containing protein [Anoxybacillus flavithermus]|uniref:Ig domain-containing protein n=1 Tax=Anoxybacillus flavithermus TaxID=33934 RepID=UPI000B49A90F|nr:Ig domain-containing protein [Anoxybacillus flavithermus]ASA96506.1 Ig domain-containing protein [Anoxybacillus flavithermus]